MENEEGRAWRKAGFDNKAVKPRTSHNSSIRASVVAALEVIITVATPSARTALDGRSSTSVAVALTGRTTARQAFGDSLILTSSPVRSCLKVK